MDRHIETGYSSSDTEDSDVSNRSIDYPDEPDSTSSDESETQLQLTDRWRARVRTAPRPLVSAISEVHCNCCLCGESGRALSKVNHGVLNFKELRDACFKELIGRDDLFTPKHLIRDSVMFAGPCGKASHTMCAGCFRMLCSERALLTRLLKEGRGYMPCMYPHDVPCCNDIGQRNVHSMDSTQFILDDTAGLSVSRLSVTIQRYCGGLEHGIDNYNHYVCDPSTRLAEYPGMFRHSEVTEDMVVAHYNRLVQQTSDEIICNICGVTLKRQTDCNTISHCGVCICAYCGRYDTCLESSSVHWQTCPRYDHPLENKSHPDTKCSQDDCFSADRDCDKPGHAAYRAALQSAKTARRLYCLMYSLTPELRERVVPRIIKTMVK